MTPIQSGRITRSYTQHIDAPPETVFPLLCPVREGEWLDGWSDICRVIHTDSGVAEEGCVFRTMSSDEVETLWTITRHDAAAGAIEFVRVTPGFVATRLQIRVERVGDASSLVHVTYTHTPVGARGTEFVASNFSAKAFADAMVWWERSMNHWLRTGETLRH